MSNHKIGVANQVADWSKVVGGGCFHGCRRVYIAVFVKLPQVGYILGSLVAQWLMLVPHKKKVLGSSLGVTISPKLILFFLQDSSGHK